jgi:GTP cyclohydrolase I
MDEFNSKGAIGDKGINDKGMNSPLTPFFDPKFGESVTEQADRALKGSHESNIKFMLESLFHHLGEDPNREGLQETPARWMKAWQTWGAGYDQDPKDVIKTFEERDYDEMVIVKDIPIYSHCEHHLAAIFGTATIAYIPFGRVLGLSKLSRLADIFARRLQVQERLTAQIADALWQSELRPKGVGVLLKCRHLCMESRGISKQGTVTLTSALRGAIQKGDPRAEFLRLANP